MTFRDPNCSRCRLCKIAKRVCDIDPPTPSKVMVLGEIVSKPLDLDLEHDYHYASAVSCNVAGHTPTKGEVRSCSVWVRKQINAVKPKFVLLIGNAALMSITGSAGIKKARGTPFEKDGITYLPTYSPGIAEYDPVQGQLVERDLALFDKIVRTGGIPRESRVRPHLVRTRNDFEEMLDSLSGRVSFDIETNGLYPWAEGAKVTTLGFGTPSGEYTILTSMWTPDQLDDMVAEMTEAVKSCKLIMQNGKFDMLWMRVHFGVQWKLHFDTMLAAYILDENRSSGLKSLAQSILAAPNWDIDKETKLGQGSVQKLATYHAHDLYYTRQLAFHLEQELDKDPQVRSVFYKILMPIANIFVDVEYDGLYVYQARFDEAERYLRGEVRRCEKELKKHADINWGSTKQLSELLYKKLKLKVMEKTKTGAPSCSESALKQLDHPLVKSLLEFRAAKQQLSFFIEGWKPFIVKTKDGWYLHPSFKLNGTVTGRLSSEHPNAQQIPRDPRIRSLIGAPPGWVLVEVDLEQIELKITAEVANERTMKEAFRNGIDIHWLTALREIERGGGQKEIVIDTASTLVQRDVGYAEAINILLQAGPDAAAEVNREWKELRKKAKAVNFGYVFGMWWRKFKEYARNNYDVKLTDEQAQDSRKFFFATYSGLEAWHNRQKAFARRHGYVRSLSGRKRRLPAATSHIDSPERGAAERQSINSPVQSFANEINLMTVIQVAEEFPRSKVRMCATVHDAILMRVRLDCVHEVVPRVLEIMKRPKLMDELDIHLSVPISADAKIGDWGTGVSLEKWSKR